MTLRKTLSESWVKARGAATAAFSGHKVVYEIDGAPRQKKEFDAVTGRLCAEGLLREAQVQAVLREITEASLTADSQNDLYAAVYELLSKIFPDFNLNIALLDEENAQVIFPYCQTEVDFLPQCRPTQKGLTEYTLRQNQTVWLTAADIERLHATGELDLKLVDLH